MDFARESQGLGCYGGRGNDEFGERKHMKKLAFVLAGAAALSLAACNKNQDQVQNAELNQPAADELNQQASDAANDAANAAAAAPVNEQNAVADNIVNPDDAQEQNVSGM